MSNAWVWSEPTSLPLGVIVCNNENACDGATCLVLSVLRRSFRFGGACVCVHDRDQNVGNRPLIHGASFVNVTCPHLSQPYFANSTCN